VQSGATPEQALYKRLPLTVRGYRLGWYSALVGAEASSRGKNCV